MRTFISSIEIPVGYLTPKFPSLYWPISNKSYSLAFLYDIVDIWKFTLYWCLIFNGAFYGATGLIATLTHKNQPRCIMILATYITYGGIQGFIVGTVMGFLIGAVYNSGLFAMSTWIPLCCAIAQILYEVVKSYSTIGSIM
ncbi:hypothetical protein C6P45_004844 [Maudiozyma exigua]|uniref:Uncharacterized protein n=1 Tax=Maudiozyma exigua TaxID=34358 RepID=A0A9P6WCP0_MAUEX|nr:hypothetical protein C6P45_004844 [Kazachstania exigua]